MKSASSVAVRACGIAYQPRPRTPATLCQDALARAWLVGVQNFTCVANHFRAISAVLSCLSSLRRGTSPYASTLVRTKATDGTCHIILPGLHEIIVLFPVHMRAKNLPVLEQILSRGEKQRIKRGNESSRFVRSLVTSIPTNVASIPTTIMSYPAHLKRGARH